MKLSPSEWMIQERKRLGFSDASKIDPVWIDSFIQNLPESEREASRAVWMSRVGTSWGEIHDEQMAGYKRNFDVALTASEKDVASQCYFGILPTRKFNAYAGRTPWGDKVIILHQALTHIIAIWCHWYTRTSEEGRNTLHTPTRRETLLKYFVQVWNADFPASGLPDIYPSSKEQWHYSETLATACMTFIMGHELGHLIHQHRGYGIDPEKNHQMEYQADQKGLEICVRLFALAAKARLNDDADAYLVGPFLSIAVSSLFGNKSSATHPSATMRKDQIMLAMSKLLEFGKSESISTHLLHLYGEVEQLFAIFSEYASEVDLLMSRYMEPENSWLESMLVAD